MPLPSAQFRAALLTTQTRELRKFSAGDLNFYDLMPAVGTHGPHTLLTLRGESLHSFGIFRDNQKGPAPEKRAEAYRTNRPHRHGAKLFEQ